MAGFDLKAFQKARFAPREMELTLEALKEAGFGDGVVKIRSLTAAELAEAEEESDRSKVLMGVAEKLAGTSREKLEGLLDGLGVGSNQVPQALARKMCHVRYGMVEPEMGLDDVTKLAEAFPIEFGQVARAIYSLTGKGQVAQVKQKPSGKKATSKQA